MPLRKPPGRPPFQDALTPGEWRVVDGVRHGLTGPQIAARAGVTPDAVKYHVRNALQKLGLPDRKALRQWNGVPRRSALNAKEKPMAGHTTLGALHQISRTVSDIAAAQRWYADVMGLPLLYAFEGMAFFDCGGVRLYLQQGAAATESPVYFKVEDIRAAHEDLQARGAVFSTAPHLVHRHPNGAEEWLAFIDDPDGRPVGLMARVEPNPPPPTP